VFKKRKDIADTLKSFVGDGDLVLCEEPSQDIIEVADLCEKVRASKLLPAKDGIGIDRIGLPGLLDELVSRGFDISENGGVITAIAQGGYLNPAIMGLERKLNDKTLVHAGQPLMTFCVGNAKIELKGSARAVTKQVSGKAKIDPLVAAFDAAMLMARNPQAEREPEYQMMIFNR
jgi:phage terminase large subunit-like protein